LKLRRKIIDLKPKLKQSARDSKPKLKLNVRESKMSRRKRDSVLLKKRKGSQLLSIKSSKSS
jgi:hypothetical protein